MVDAPHSDDDHFDPRDVPMPFILPNIVAAKNCGLTESQIRKMQPVGSIVTLYFPDALRAVAAVAWVGNEKHNPGQHLHWARGKSDDHLECAVRHLQDANREQWDVTTLKDGRQYAVLHAAEAAWRALALLQLAVEQGGEVIQVLHLGETAQDGRTQASGREGVD